MTGSSNDGPPAYLEPDDGSDDDLVLQRLRSASASEAIDADELPPPEFGDIDSEDAWGGRQMLQLLGLTLLAALLRLFRLHEWSLWVDESHTLRDSTMDITQFWGGFVANYPVSSLTLRSVLDYLPELSEGWLRLPFAFAGILSVPLLAIAGRSIVGSRAALLAALFLAVAPWHLYWSQNVRGYALMLPFAIASVGMFWSAVQRGSVTLYVLSLLALTAAGLTHPTAYFIGAVFIVVVFLTLWYRPGIYRTGLLVWSILILLALAFVVYQFVGQHVEHVLSAKSSPSIGHFVKTSAFYFRVPLSLAAVCGFFALRRSENNAAGWFLGLWAFLPIALLALLSIATFQVTAQYAFYCLPGFCLLAAAVSVEVMRRVEVAGSLGRLVACALPIVLVVEMLGYDALYFSVQHGDRPRWQEAAAMVAENTMDRKLVLTTNGPSMQYYLHRDVYFGALPDSGRVEVRSIEKWDIAREGGGVDFMRQAQLEAIANGRSLYVVLTEPEFHEKDPDGEAEKWLRTRGHQIARFEAWTGPKDMTVYVFRVPTSR